MSQLETETLKVELKPIIKSDFPRKAPAKAFYPRPSPWNSGSTIRFIMPLLQI